MRVEVWSDVVCPWCYIGKRRFEKAVEQSGFAGEVEVTWRSFELDSSASKFDPTESSRVDMAARLARKYRMSEDQARESIANITSLASREGLDYHLDQAKQGNSFDAHRLIQLAGIHALGSAMKERLLRAYFVESRDISDQDTLVELGTEVGLERDEIREMYASDYMASNVRGDEERAGQLGISGVPFFVFEDKYGVSGAQSVDVFLEVLRKVHGETSLVEFVGEASGSNCDEGSCAI